MSGDPRAGWERYASPLAFVLAIACMLGPFVAITLDERRGSATGFQLVADRPSFHGRYIQAAYMGEAETLMHHGVWPARVVFVLCLIGACSILLSWRRACWVSLGASALGVLTLFILRFASSSRFHPPYSHFRAGFWLCIVVLAAIAVWNIRLLRREDDDPPGLGWHRT